MKFYIETYGCTSNQNDSEIMSGLLREKTHIMTDEKEADVIIINTCSVKSTTENKILSRIKKIKNRKIIIAGCMPDSEYNIIKKTAPHASLLGTSHIDKIVEISEKTLDGKRIELLGKQKLDKTVLPKYSENNIIEKVEIESGCNFSCSFCSTKLAKSYTFSYSQDNITKSIEKNVLSGFREFWITGQDVAGYMHEKSALPDLINKIAETVRGNYFLRLGMMHPSSVLPILDELIESYKSDKVFKFLHLPVQSGSDTVLKKMSRTHDVDDFILIVKSFRKAFPRMTIWTDMICGFPGETDDDFLLSIDLLKKTKPDFVNVSAYGVRPDTRAAKMKQIPTEIKKGRTREMSALVDKISLEANKKWLGWSGSVLVNEFKKDKDNFIGRNFAYKPVAIKKGSLGESIKVKITGIEKTCLIGKVIK
jgi:MiaB-like tRNA modifying enzyme